MYPWRLGQTLCLFKVFMLEFTSHASVLIITGFTIERYISICHPNKDHKVSRRTRVRNYIIGIWLFSAIFALPLTGITRTFSYLRDPQTNRPIQGSLLCYVPGHYHHYMNIIFHIYTFVFFVFPIVLIIYLYVMICMKIKKTEIRAKISSMKNNRKYTKRTKCSHMLNARREVMKMLGK